MKLFVFAGLLAVSAYGSEIKEDALVVKSKKSKNQEVTHIFKNSSKGSWKEDVDEIDKEIDKLVNQRNLYLAKATRLQNQGDRLQFENNNLIDARRAWQQAQINREIATRIQEEIDVLEERRQKILHKHGVDDYSKTEAATSSAE